MAAPTLSRSGQAWVNRRKDEFDVFFIQPVIEAAAAITQARGGRKISADDLEAAESDELALPPEIQGDGRP